MNGRDMILVLAHLFRKKGSPVSIVEAVDFLSFKCRYGSPSDVRKMLTMALNNEMISKKLKDDGFILMGPVDDHFVEFEPPDSDDTERKRNEIEKEG